VITGFKHTGLEKFFTKGIEGNLMRMHNPPHPGEILRKLGLEPLGLSVTEAAKALGISRKTLSSILNGRAGISAEMAVRLSIAFDTTAESWMNQQVHYDLWQAERGRGQLKVTRLTVAERINA
jgi:antitoxin HigA-1